jgi:hypothetical protein
VVLIASVEAIASRTAVRGDAEEEVIEELSELVIRYMLRDE